jgi:hypothetical protein
MAGKRLVNRVIDNLEDHVMETGAIVGISDVHAGSLTDRVEAL